VVALIPATAKPETYFFLGGARCGVHLFTYLTTHHNRPQKRCGFCNWCDNPLPLFNSAMVAHWRAHKAITVWPQPNPQPPFCLWADGDKHF